MQQTKMYMRVHIDEANRGKSMRLIGVFRFLSEIHVLTTTTTGDPWACTDATLC